MTEHKLIITGDPSDPYMIVHPDGCPQMNIGDDQFTIMTPACGEARVESEYGIDEALPAWKGLAPGGYGIEYVNRVVEYPGVREIAEEGFRLTGSMDPDASNLERLIMRLKGWVR